MSRSRNTIDADGHVLEPFSLTGCRHQDGFFPGAPQMVRDRLGPLSPAARHQVMAGGAMGFYGLN